MAIDPGSRLGSFELIRRLGAGGMGEVWLATDAQLQRKVAIKFLPAAMTADPDRVRRFEQEARAASALNHPNVCTVHALGTTADGQRYIAMEHVEGSTLRGVPAGRRSTWTEQLDVAIQMASALTAAHAAGIVHRDLKPENVMVRADGIVKVLDFGLAKLVAVDGDASLVTETLPGSVVGTVRYMSPEQARGLEVDARTDVWSLGVVLYEMAAGRPPFAGATTSDTLAAIIEHEPAPLASLAPTAPPELARIVTKSLRKDREERYQVMKEFLLDLRALREELSSRRLAAASPSGPGRRHVAWRKIALAALAVAALVVVASVWSRVRRPAPEAVTPAVPSATSVDRPLTRLTFGQGLQTDVAFSPDGRSIAFASDRAGNFDIWVQPLDGGEARQLTTSPAQETQPAWSPDGTRIVFRSEGGGGGLFLVPVQGGAERQLTSFGVYPEWSSTGAQILFRSALFRDHTGLHAVSPDGGEAARDLTPRFIRDGAFSTAFHPDGRLSAIGIDGKGQFGFYTVSRDGAAVVASAHVGLPFGAPSEIAQISRLRWDRTGRFLYVEGAVNEVHNVWRVRIDPSSLAWLAADRLTNGSGPDVRAAVSPDGKRLAYTSESRSTRLWTFPLDAARGRLGAQGKPLTADDGSAAYCTLSPDGRFVAYTLVRAGSRRAELVLTDIDGGRTERVGEGAFPGAWTPDGRTLAYTLSRTAGSRTEWALAVRKIGGPERIVRGWSSESILLPTSWMPDGEHILGPFLAPLYTGNRGLAFWPVEPAADQRERMIVARANRRLWQGMLSPDGRSVAFSAVHTDDRSIEIHIARVDGGVSSAWLRVAPDHPVTDKPRWSHDGTTLYFLSNEGSSYFNLWGTRFDPARGTLVGAPFVLTAFDSPGRILDLLQEGAEIGISVQRAVLPITTVQGNIWMLENVDR